MPTGRCCSGSPATDFDARQNAASETAFARALSDQLRGARVDTAVCYRDTQSHQWVEHDLLIRLDDVLIVVDAEGRRRTRGRPRPISTGMSRTC